jgi:hypothetical protein
MNVPFVMGELESIVGQNDVDPVGHGGDQVAQEDCCDHLSGFRMHLDEGDLGAAVEGHEEILLALSPLNLGNFNEDVAERAGLELPGQGLTQSTSLRRLISCRCKERRSYERVRCGIKRIPKSVQRFSDKNARKNKS